MRIKAVIIVGIALFGAACATLAGKGSQPVTNGGSHTGSSVSDGGPPGVGSERHPVIEPGPGQYIHT
jgi:hypothetical protein